MYNLLVHASYVKSTHDNRGCRWERARIAHKILHRRMSIVQDTAIEASLTVTHRDLEEQAL